jgi:antitoxin component of MazEF toxin-antitoxin module
MSVVFKRRIRKWGGSLVCALPEELLDALQLKLGDELVLSLEQNSIIAKRAGENR